jgi:hypothetical protein
MTTKKAPEGYPELTPPEVETEGDWPNDWIRFRAAPTVRAKEMPEPFSVETKAGFEKGEAGDYAVVDDKGGLSIVERAKFHERYEPAV